MQFPRHRILIFARAPVPGQCKRRLVPALGKTGAADVARRLLAHILQQVESAQVAPAILCCTPDTGHPAFAGWAQRRWPQQGEELGGRMAHAARFALAEAERVLLIGSDCPAVDGTYLRQAFEALDRAEVVLGPAEDGGYVLLGLRRIDDSLFRGVAWGTDRVLAQTRERVGALGWSCELLEPLRDVDRPEDLDWLGREFPAISSG